MQTNGGFLGKVAIITGGRQGIGRGIAHHLASLGCNTCIVDIRDSRVTARELRSHGVRAKAYIADVSRPSSVQSVVRRIIGDFRHVDILVNDAGVSFFAPFLQTSEQNWDRTLDVNLKGVFIFSRIVAGHMKRRRYGKIVNIVSNAAILGYRDLSSYIASKAGCAALTMAMAVELGPYGINVNGVSPGTVKVGETSREYLKGGREKTETLATPLRRLGSPEDIARLVAFLASDDSSWITGQTITIDGGFSLVPA
jgi:3-oxoacyl-[acyl-carrier protein] reductase